MANIYPRDYLINKKFIYLGKEKNYYNKLCLLVVHRYNTGDYYMLSLYDPITTKINIKPDAPAIKKDDFIRCELFNEEKYPEYFI